jgi:hypothetical protein
MYLLLNKHENLEKKKIYPLGILTPAFDKVHFLEVFSALSLKYK